MAQDIATAIRGLLPGIEAQAAQTETDRRIAPATIDDLRQAGMFRMLAANEHGGAETAYPISVQLLTDLARADGSVGWSLMIGCETPQLLALLDRKVMDDLYAENPDVIIAGAFAPKGKATAVDGGYQVSGRWGFASGCEHADWLFGNCVLNPEGTLRCMMLKRDEWDIQDTWHTSGLRGTGSHDIVLEDVYVPSEHSFDLFGGKSCIDRPLFAAPIQQFALHIGAVALGIAEGALEELTEFAQGGKTRLYARSSMIESELFQYRLGHAEADARAARAMLEAQVNEYWRHAQSGEFPEGYDVTVQQTEAWVVEMAARIVDACYTAGGGSAIYTDSPLQRRLRDIHTLTAHASAQEGVFANAGELRLR
jgi:alkylation response protein AidB-like acyl-CoA dehydrogenase